MHNPVLVTAPTAFVTVADMKKWCRVDDDDNDDVLTALIDAAIAYLDGYTGCLGRCLAVQTWRQDFDGFSPVLSLPLAPVISIASVKYTDANDVEQTVSSSDYKLLNMVSGPAVGLAHEKDWPGDVIDDYRSVRVEYVAGYAAVPEDLKTCVKLIAAHWYENREPVSIGNLTTQLPIGVQAIIARYNRVGV